MCNPIRSKRGTTPVTGPDSGCSISVPSVIANGSNEVDSITGSSSAMNRYDIRITGSPGAMPSRSAITLDAVVFRLV